MIKIIGYELNGVYVKHDKPIIKHVEKEYQLNGFRVLEFTDKSKTKYNIWKIIKN